MISLEQVQLLEAKVARAVEYVQRVTAENTALSSERAHLQIKLETNQKRIDELEVLVMRFKEDQSRIEDGIIAALDRLSQFEEAFENSLKEEKSAVKKQAAKPREKAAQPESKGIFFEIPEASGDLSSVSKNETDNDDELLGDELSSEGELDIF